VESVQIWKKGCVIFKNGEGAFGVKKETREDIGFKAEEKEVLVSWRDVRAGSNENIG